MRIFPIITLFLILILSSLTVMASEADDGITSANPGVDHNGLYLQGGQGDIDAATLTSSSRALDSAQQNTPIITDLTLDNTNEILTQENDTVSIYDIDSSSNIYLVTSYDVGSIEAGLSRTVTPAAYRHNSTDTHVITSNATHLLILTFNSTHLTLLNAYDNSTTGCENIAGTVTHHSTFVCSAVTDPTDSTIINCFRTTTYNGLTDSTVICRHDTNNSYNDVAVVGGLNARYQDRNIPHIDDVDADGTREVVFFSTQIGITPVDAYVYLIGVNSTNNITNSLIFTANNEAPNHNEITDIIPYDIDGAPSNGNEISWAYSNDGTNYYVHTIDYTGAEIEADYFSILSAPEGDQTISNMFPMTTCGVTSSGIAQLGFLVHDDTALTTTLACVSLYAGVDFELYEYDDASEFNAQDRAISARLTDTSYDVTYSNVVYDFSANALLATVNLTGSRAIIPIDYARTGTLDLLGYNETRMTYMDDNLVNDNVEILSYTYSSGNPVCNNTKVIFQVNLDDDEGDVATCSMEILFLNDTSVYNATNQSTVTPGTVTFQYTFAPASGTETYKVMFRCRDQYHAALVEQQHTLWTSTTECFSFNQGGGTNETVTAETAAANAVDDSVESTIDILLGTGDTLRNIVGLAIVIGIMLFAGMRYKNGLVGITAGMIGLILVTLLGLVSAYILILVLVGMILIIILSRMVFSGGNGQ